MHRRATAEAVEGALAAYRTSVLHLEMTARSVYVNSDYDLKDMDMDADAVTVTGPMTDKDMDEDGTSGVMV